MYLESVELNGLVVSSEKMKIYRIVLENSSRSV